MLNLIPDFFCLPEQMQAQLHNLQGLCKMKTQGPLFKKQEKSAIKLLKFKATKI